MPETITKRVDGESYVSLYFDGSILPDETKALLNALAKEEIENNTFCGELPDGIIDKNKTLYYIDITLDKKTFITAIRLGAELVIADDYLQEARAPTNTNRQSANIAPKVITISVYPRFAVHSPRLRLNPKRQMKNVKSFYGL